MKNTHKRINFLQQLREVIAPEDIIEAACRLGAIKRQRKVDMPALVEATIAAMSPIPGSETTAFVNYISLTGQTLAPSAFYSRFSEPFAELMKELAQRGREAVQEVSPEDTCLSEYDALLAQFDDVRLTDSTCKTLKILAENYAPSTSKKRPAGLKFHTVISMKDVLPIAGDITAQRIHDNKMFRKETLQAGTLSLFDLGYIDVKRFIHAEEVGAFYVTRLKQSHNPILVGVHVGSGLRRQAKGMGVYDAMAAGYLSTARGVLDVDVELEHKGKKVIARIVAIEDENNLLHWYLTNVSRDVLSPEAIAESYRVRWHIELFL